MNKIKNDVTFPRLGPTLTMLRVPLTALAALLAIVMVCYRAEATDCSKTPDLLENCDQWTACVKSAGVGCYGSDGSQGSGNNEL